jgi:hypothetical protein
VDDTGRVVNGVALADFATGVTHGTYTRVVVDGNGWVISGDNASTGNGVNTTSGYWPAPMSLSLIGDVFGSISFDGSLPATIAVSLIRGLVDPGTYVQVSVDDTGRVINGVALANLVVDCGIY